MAFAIYLSRYRQRLNDGILGMGLEETGTDRRVFEAFGCCLQLDRSGLRDQVGIPLMYFGVAVDG
jgi:hypothetical protein